MRLPSCIPDDVGRIDWSDDPQTQGMLRAKFGIGTKRTRAQKDAEWFARNKPKRKQRRKTRHGNPRLPERCFAPSPDRKGTPNVS